MEFSVHKRQWKDKVHLDMISSQVLDCGEFWTFVLSLSKKNIDSEHISRAHFESGLHCTSAKL